MAQQAAITVFDGAGTPVSHTLQPIDNKVLKDGTRYVLWREYIASLPTEACIYAELRQRVLPSGVTETRFRVVTPVMESVSGQNAAGYTAAPKVAYFESDEYVKYSHPRSTGSVRQVNAQLLRNALSNVSTSVAAVAAGVIYDAVIPQVMPS